MALARLRDQVLRGLSARDEDASRLGEFALVDGAGRVGPLDTAFYDTLLDENAAGHIALGAGLDVGVDDDRDREQISRSGIHIDFMVGADETEAVGRTVDDEEIALLRGGTRRIRR